MNAKFVKKKRFIFLLIGIFVIVGIIIYPYYTFVTKDLGISLFKVILPLTSIKQLNDHTNILLLGKGDITHDGPNLTDSINVVSYNYKTHRLISIGIPRDIWSSSLDEKINAAYAIGEAEKKGGGITLAKAEISSIIGEPIHYAVVVDFDMFKKIVNFFGGIDVNVDNSFTDHLYPIEGKENDPCNGDPQYHCRYQTVSFKQGPQHMDGERALIYVRSRHAEGIEGSDFARNKRQQKVIASLEKSLQQLILKRDTLSLTKLYHLVNTSIDKDLTNDQMAVLIKDIILNKKTAKQTLELNPDFFEVPNPQLYEGRYVLIPKNNSYQAIYQYIECKLNASENC